jgi:fumarate reductase subunit D
MSATSRAWAARRHPGYFAFLAHRVSGVLLAVFLPVHFLVLGLALEDGAAFDGFLRWTEAPLVKLAEWGLVLLLSVHLAAGLRLLVLELLPWRGARHGLIGWGAGAALAAGLAFLWQAFGT